MTVTLSNHGFLDEVYAVPFSGPDQPAPPLPPLPPPDPPAPAPRLPANPAIAFVHPNARLTASKSGIAGITRLLANEWAVKGINVNAIAPGYIATNNTAALRADEGRNREILARIPAGRWGEPDDLKSAVVFMASPASDYVSGSILVVDGGSMAR